MTKEIDTSPPDESLENAEAVLREHDTTSTDVDTLNEEL
jgi:hypothetical protein